MSKNMKNILSLLIATIAVTGCSLVSPSRPTAKAVVNNDWVSTSPGLNLSTESINKESGNYWWYKYQDNTLNGLMESAFANNNQLQIAGANVELANAQLKRIEFAWIPNFSALAGYSSFPAWGNLGYFFGAMANYSINVFQQISQQKQAEYIVDTIMYAKERVQLEVIYQVSTSYFGLLANQEELALYQKLLGDMQIVLALNENRFTTGVSSVKDPYINQTEIADIKAKIETIKHNIVLSGNALKFLTNQNPGVIATSNKFLNLNPNIMIPGSLPLTTLNNRPDVAEVTQRLQAANEGIGVAQSELLPSINFSNFYRDASQNYNTNYAPGDLKQLVATVPILNAQVFADIAVSNAIYKQVYYNYLQTVVGALREVDNDISAHNQFYQQLNQNVTALDYINKNCFLEKSKFDAGISSNLDYMKCVVREDYYKIIVTQIKLGKMLATAKLYQDFAIIRE